MYEVVFIYPIIHTSFIKKSVETLWKYTDREKFRIIVIDQSLQGMDREWMDRYVDFSIRTKNLGFAKAANEGIIHALRWKVPYIGIVNDDTEFMYQGWWKDLLEEFKTDKKIVAVCPESPRVPLWGYGRPHEEYIDIVEYKNEYTPEDIVYLKTGNYEKLFERYELEPMEIPDKLPDGRPDWKGKIYIPCDKQAVKEGVHKSVFPITKRGVIDGIAMWLPVFKREAFLELGLFDERYRWGGGEDYDMLCRAYSCGWPTPRDTCEPAYHRRMVSSMRSWVWHWWGQSKDKKETLDPVLFSHKEPWNNPDELWPPEINKGFHFDTWGHYDDNGIRRPFRRVRDVCVNSL